MTDAGISTGTITTGAALPAAQSDDGSQARVIDQADPIEEPRRILGGQRSARTKRQATRSFELRAALALAKLYQSTARPAEVRDVLAPTLEGFAPTPEMPEIAEAMSLLARLA